MLLCTTWKFQRVKTFLVTSYFSPSHLFLCLITVSLGPRCFGYLDKSGCRALPRTSGDFTIKNTGIVSQMSQKLPYMFVSLARWRAKSWMKLLHYDTLYFSLLTHSFAIPNVSHSLIPSVLPHPSHHISHEEEKEKSYQNLSDARTRVPGYSSQQQCQVMVDACFNQCNGQKPYGW